MTRTSNPWLRPLGPAPAAPTRLVFLPHAGGAAGWYRPFGLALTPRMDVWGVQYPGRLDRIAEPGLSSLDVLVDEIAAALTDTDDGRPLVLFGHSMGAVVAFALAARVTPARLVVSGRRPPSDPPPATDVPTDDAEILAELRRLGGTDVALLDPEILPLVLPALRSDYAALRAHRGDPTAVVTCPVTVCTGDADPRVTPAQARQWARHTTSATDVHVYPGDHFFLTHHVQAIAEVLLGHA